MPVNINLEKLFKTTYNPILPIFPILSNENSRENLQNRENRENRVVGKNENILSNALNPNSIKLDNAKKCNRQRLIRSDGMSVKALVDSLNEKMSPSWASGQPSRYRHIDDTGSFSVNLFPTRKPTHAARCDKCTCYRSVEWLKGVLCCVECQTPVDVYSAYEVNKI